MTIFNCCPGYTIVYEKKSYPYNILDQRVADFKPLHNVIDSIVAGAVTNKQGDIITCKEEDMEQVCDGYI